MGMPSIFFDKRNPTPKDLNIWPNGNIYFIAHIFPLSVFRIGVIKPTACRPLAALITMRWYTAPVF